MGIALHMSAFASEADMNRFFLPIVFPIAFIWEDGRVQKLA
jgi:hypothetical protein